jgi:hypothetical protein
VIALGVATAGSADPRIGLLVALAAFGAFLATTPPTFSAGGSGRR